MLISNLICNTPIIRGGKLNQSECFDIRPKGVQGFMEGHRG